jgi:hypothetical protein
LPPSIQQFVQQQTIAPILANLIGQDLVTVVALIASLASWYSTGFPASAYSGKTPKD